MIIYLAKMTDEQYDALPEVIVIQKIAALYVIEGKTKALAPEERLERRQQEENMNLIPAEKGGDDYYLNGGYVKLQDAGKQVKTEPAAEDTRRKK